MNDTLKCDHSINLSFVIINICLAAHKTITSSSCLFYNYKGFARRGNESHAQSPNMKGLMKDMNSDL